MLNKGLFNTEINEKDKNKEFTEEDYEQINKEISKALFEMKTEKQDESDSDEDINENEKPLNSFDYDFFYDNISISNDNISDISENSFKSAKVEMNRNNSSKLNMLKSNFKVNSSNSLSRITKDFSSSSNEGINESLNFRQNSFNSMKNENNSNIQNNSLNRENNGKAFNSSPYLINLGNSRPFNNNYLNEPPGIINLNMNNNNQNINPPLININNNNPNKKMNINNQPIINNNFNFLNTYNNYFNNNNPINNINLINLNNNINNNQFMINSNSNNFLQFPSISERGVPGLYNLDSPKNIINLENILKSRDKRTTLIIRNIPNKYTISLLLDELKTNFENKFDILYLPQDYINNSNLGFGFINFVNHMHLILFYEEFVGKKWNCFNSKKRCQLAYSKYQGKNELMKYILTKLGISNLDNNNENIKKSFYINNSKNIRAPIELPIKYYSNFISFYPFSLCHNKDDKVFIIDKYYNI